MPVSCWTIRHAFTKAARLQGFFTILVGKESAMDDADAAMINWNDLPGLLDGRI